jgi:flavin reductase (DIM6/NTAB) family NADH-FMN oxidoreductase RutF
VPVLDDCPDWFAGEILSRHDTGDHVGMLLRPTHSARGDDHPRRLGFQAVRGLTPGNDP